MEQIIFKKQFITEKENKLPKCKIVHLRQMVHVLVYQ